MFSSRKPAQVNYKACFVRIQEANGLYNIAALTSSVFVG